MQVTCRRPKCQRSKFIFSIEKWLWHKVALDFGFRLRRRITLHRSNSFGLICFIFLHSLPCVCKSIHTCTLHKPMIYRTDSTLIFCVSSSIKFVYIKTDFKNEIPNVRSESMPNMHSNKWAHSTFHHLKCDFSIVLKSNRLTCVLSSMQSIHLCNNNKTLEKHFKNSKWINLNHMDQWVWVWVWCDLFFHLF